MAVATPLAYNVGSAISGTQQIGNLSIGTPTSGFTNNPQYWNGPDEELGYVIGVPVSGNTQPTPVTGVTASVGFFRSDALTEISFVNYTNDLFGQNFTTGNSAKTWLNQQGYWTSWGEGIVSDGLTLKLDASNSISYPGTGNTWVDLISPQENINLVNSPSYTSTSPSYFTFNGSNQYGTGSGQVVSSTSYTKSVWFYLSSYADNNLVSSSDGGHFMYFGAGTNKLYCGHTNWPVYTVFPSIASFSLNTWYYAAVTFNTTDGMKLYINGLLDNTYTANKSAFVGDGSTNLACFTPGGNLLNGRIARVYCYNKSLSAAEVLQNYNANAPEF